MRPPPRLDPSRRAVLATGLGLATAALLDDWPGVCAAAEAASTDGGEGPWSVFTPSQAADVEAICAQVVPSDETPGAREAGVVRFVDRALGSFFSARAPRFLEGLAGFQRACAADNAHAGPFATWTSGEQVRFLERIDTTEFFLAVRDLTLLGLFTMPSYGGNLGGVGWDLLGFQDLHTFQPPFGHYDRDYEGFVPQKP